jgi:NitT/TauT family transport system permease protein
MINFLAAILILVALLTVIILVGKWQVRKNLSRSTELLLTAAFLVLSLAAWTFVTNGEKVEDRMVSPLILASPVEVLQQFPRLHTEQALVRNAITSFKRVTLGFSFAALLAVPLGLYMASFTRIAAFFRPLALIGGYVPIVVFIPLTLAWFGMSELQKIVFLFISCFVVLLPMVFKTVADVPSAYLDVARTKGATQWQQVTRVLFPIARADIWDHLRAVYGVGWGWIIMAEVVNAEKGLGFMMSLAERRGHTASIFAIIAVIICIAVICDQIWKYTGKWLFPYRDR